MAGIRKHLLRQSSLVNEWFCFPGSLSLSLSVSISVRVCLSLSLSPTHAHVHTIYIHFNRKSLYAITLKYRFVAYSLAYINTVSILEITIDFQNFSLMKVRNGFFLPHTIGLISLINTKSHENIETVCFCSRK